MMTKKLPDHAFRLKPATGTHGWAYCLTAADAVDMIEGGDTDGYGYIVEKVTMTQEQFDALGDFEGW